MRSRFPAFVAAAVLMAVAIGGLQNSLLADVVVGNLGPTGSGSLSDSGSDFGPAAASLKVLAQGFTTGSDPAFLTLESISMGAFYDNAQTANLTVSLYSNGGGNNPGSLVATSSPTSVGAKGTYNFSFTPVTLAATTNYWVVPQFDVDWFWYLPQSEAQPVAENGSGYGYLGTRRSDGTISGTWSNTSQPYAVSVNAVPEPTTIGLAIAGLAGCGLAFARRRMKTR
jgi:hypothetical protein